MKPVAKALIDVLSPPRLGQHIGDKCVLDAVGDTELFSRQFWFDVRLA